MGDPPKNSASGGGKRNSCYTAAMKRYPRRPDRDAPDSPWHTLATHEAYSNRWLTVTEFQVVRPDGLRGIYGVSDPGDNVTIVALDDQGQVLMVHDFAFPVLQWRWSLP